MPITLYDATVSTYLQILGSLRGVLDKGLAHAQATGIDPDSLAQARLIEDMQPLAFQVQNVAAHSAGALRDVKQGAFTIPKRDTSDYAGLQRLVAESETSVQGWSREAVEALEGREVALEIGGQRTIFTAEAFLTSVSLPNFYFHAVTAYDILRMTGVPIGKRDYLSGIRTRL